MRWFALCFYMGVFATASVIAAPPPVERYVASEGSGAPGMTESDWL